MDDAWNLARLMLLALGDQSDDRAMQIDAGLKVIEKKLNKAHDQIDLLDNSEPLFDSIDSRKV